MHRALALVVLLLPSAPVGAQPAPTLKPEVKQALRDDALRGVRARLEAGRKKQLVLRREATAPPRPPADGTVVDWLRFAHRQITTR
ncbi:MAG: hypothetical protein H6704_02370 [Myxococcales bacterium]|nr:hypothetical protein [Myxococcales bacterium]